MTDTDPKNEAKALDFLRRAGLDEPIRYHVAAAFDAFSATEGDFDVVYCDIDKDGYPEAWRLARERIRVGGLFICDNVLWSGRVTDESDEPDVREGFTKAIRELNSTVEAESDYRATIVPTRDGVLAAVRIA